MLFDPHPLNEQEEDGEQNALIVSKKAPKHNCNQKRLKYPNPFSEAKLKPKTKTTFSRN